MVGGRHGGRVTLAALFTLWACSGEATGARAAPGERDSTLSVDSLASDRSIDSLQAGTTPVREALPSAHPQHPLEGTEWVLVELPGAPAPPRGADATLVLDRDERVLRGSTGCNDFDGSWEIAGTRLMLGVTGISGRPCDAALARLQTDYIEALRRTGSFRLRGDVLELLGEAGVVARLEPRGRTGGA